MPQLTSFQLMTLVWDSLKRLSGQRSPVKHILPGIASSDGGGEGRDGQRGSQAPPAFVSFCFVFASEIGCKLLNDNLVD